MCVLEQARGREEKKEVKGLFRASSLLALVCGAGSLLLFLLLHYLGQFPTVPLLSMSHLTAGTGCVFIPSNFYIHSGTISGQIFMASAFIC